MRTTALLLLSLCVFLPACPSDDGDGDGMTLFATGMIDGQPFTISCDGNIGQLFSGNGQYNYQCRNDSMEGNPQLTGPVNMFDFNTAMVEMGTRGVGGDNPRAFVIVRDDWVSLVPGGDNNTAEITFDIVTETHLAGSFGGSWANAPGADGVEVEVQGTFDITFEIL